MTATHRPDPDAVFNRHLAAWEARQPAPEGWGQRVETAARAIFWADQFWLTADEFDAGWTNPLVKARHHQLAAAALTADAAHAFEPGDNLSDHPKAAQSGRVDDHSWADAMQVGPDPVVELAQALLSQAQPHVEWRSAGSEVQAVFREQAASLIHACPALRDSLDGPP